MNFLTYWTLTAKKDFGGLEIANIPHLSLAYIPMVTGEYSRDELGEAVSLYLPLFILISILALMLSLVNMIGEEREKKLRA